MAIQTQVQDTLILRAEGISHQGMTSKRNEDRFFIDNKREVFCVADGVGGLPFGNKASESAVQALRRYIESHPCDKPMSSYAVVQDVQRVVQQIGRLISREHGIGTTFTFIHRKGNACEIGHVGDSAAFLISPHKAIRLTPEHMDEYTPNIKILNPAKGQCRANQQPKRKRLSRYVGQSASLHPTVFVFRPQDRNRLLICSDGISSSLSASEIATVSKAQSVPSGFLQSLIKIVNLRGGYDNATAVVIECERVNPQPDYYL